MPFASCGEADDGAWQRCVDGCMAPFASLAGDCHDELFTLIDCMAANLDPGAACYREGDLCTGEGCPSSFSRNCARELMNLSLCGPPSLPAPLAMGCAFVGRQDDGSCTLDMTCGDITYTASCLGVTSALYDEFSVCDCSTAPPPPTWDAGVNAPIGRACVLWLRDCGAPL